MNFLTITDLALKFGVARHCVALALRRSTTIKPAANKGGVLLYSSNQVPAIRALVRASMNRAGRKSTAMAMA